MPKGRLTKGRRWKSPPVAGYGVRDVLGLNTVKDEPALGGVGPIDRTRHVEHDGRNDDCPCGSGRRFKRCHGRSGWRRRWFAWRRGVDDAS
jgi:preprotein translocase subunit SecA